MSDDVSLLEAILDALLTLFGREVLQKKVDERAEIAAARAAADEEARARFGEAP